jgi:hypothetical protein
LRDWSGLARHGTLVSGGQFMVSSRFAILLNGTDQFLSLSAVVLPRPFTASFWINPTSVSGDIRLLNPSVGTYPQFFCRINSGNFEVLNAGGDTWLTLATGITANVWTHLCLTATTTETVGFVNGSERNTVAAAAGIIDNLTFGSRYGSFGQFFPGLFDDIMLCNRVRGRREIRTLASRRGIAYELAPRRRSALVAGFRAHWVRRRSLVIGGGIN